MKKEEKENFIKIIIEADRRLREVEVKGDSVEMLLSARVMLKELAKNLDEMKEEKEE